MAVIEKINEINEAIKEVFEFTQANETVRNDFSEYLATIGARDISLTQMVDNGCIEHFNEDYLNNAVAKLEKLNK